MDRSPVSVKSALIFALKIGAVAVFFTISALLLRFFFQKSNLPESAANASTEKQRIIIDAGHGGIDGGAVSVTGTLEKDLNLRLSLVLRDVFKCFGYDVYMTRSDDTMPDSGENSGSRKQRDLRARLLMTDSMPDAILISIHMNKFPQEKYSGMQVYYSVNNPSGKQIAESIRSLNSALLAPDNKRETKPADSKIYLLYKTKIPAVLVECGFISNVKEAELLETGEYRQKLACVIFCGAADTICGV
ncbi:MAG: N-acetylmuramoyl-L-alanine amidase [Firmicutes bacterium]|nr:N-acetylmuramoyl-L-alanine amidase [Bacillota bacterium]